MDVSFSKWNQLFIIITKKNTTQCMCGSVCVCVHAHVCACVCIRDVAGSTD